MTWKDRFVRDWDLNEVWAVRLRIGWGSRRGSGKQSDPRICRHSRRLEDERASKNLMERLTTLGTTLSPGLRMQD